MSTYCCSAKRPSERWRRVAAIVVRASRPQDELLCWRSAASRRHPVHEPRPSGPPLATQRRAISVVGEQNRENCDHADHANGGLLANGRRFSHRLRRGVPGPHLCEARRVAGRSLLHKYGPGTSRWAVLFVSVYGFGHGYGCGHGYGFGNGHGNGNGRGLSSSLGEGKTRDNECGEAKQRSLAIDFSSSEH